MLISATKSVFEGFFEKIQSKLAKIAIKENNWYNGHSSEKKFFFSKN